jgi:hypothetical protein
VITGLVPAKVIDTLLSDALAGRRLRHPILNFLWGALFTELWLKEQGLHP